MSVKYWYFLWNSLLQKQPKVFLGKGILKICSKFTGEHPCRSVISTKLFAILLKSHLGIGVLLQIYCIFSEYLFLKRPLNGCFCCSFEFMDWCKSGWWAREKESRLLNNNTIISLFILEFKTNIWNLNIK